MKNCKLWPQFISACLLVGLLVPGSTSHGEAAHAVTNELVNSMLGKSADPVFLQTLAKAEKGDAAAQVTIGTMFSDGLHGVAKNDAEAARWFEMAAKHGYPLGQLLLGIAFWEGKGKPMNQAEAVKWYRRAAEQ